MFSNSQTENIKAGCLMAVMTHIATDSTEKSARKKNFFSASFSWPTQVGHAPAGKSAGRMLQNRKQGNFQ
jgi:hypothetical protein